MSFFHGSNIPVPNKVILELGKHNQPTLDSIIRICFLTQLPMPIICLGYYKKQGYAQTRVIKQRTIYNGVEGERRKRKGKERE